MAIERTEPPYMQLAHDLRTKIVEGVIEPGAVLPSIRAVAAREGLSIATVTKAYAVLKTLGLTRGVAGVGTIVVEDDNLRVSGQDRMRAVLHTGRFYASTGQYAEIKRAEVAPAPATVARDLGLPEGSDVIQRERVTYRADGTPLSVSVSYHPVELAEVAPRLLERERIKEGPGYVAQVTGRVPVPGADRLSARACTDHEAEMLRIPPGTPVLQMVTQVRSANDEHIEYGVSVSATREVTYTYSLGSG